MIKLIIGVVAATIVLIVVLYNVEKYTNGTYDNQTTSTNNTTSYNEDNYTLTITGEVNKPGTYYLDEDCTLSDLISAAGGVTNNADDKAYNLDYLCQDNQVFYIAPIYDDGDTCAQTAITKYNINSASEEELMNINGVKSNVAANIVAYRESKEFERIEDLKEVSYIGSATFEKMKNYVTLK